MGEKFVLLLKRFLGTLTRKFLGSHVSGLVVNSENGRLVVSPDDYGVGRWLRWSGGYGKEEIERLKPYLSPESRVLIIGAHIGALAIPISQLCQETIAIEANPFSYELLTTNITLNAAKNIQGINIAVSNKNEKIPFLLNKINSGGSKRVPKIKDFKYYYDNPKTILIDAVSLDSYLKNPTFDVVVMDIEGSEYYALQGMQDILSQTKRLVIEFSPHHLKNVSGVTVEEFLAVISPHFSRLKIPSQNLYLNHDDFLPHLQKMFEKNQGDESLMFEKAFD